MSSSPARSRTALLLLLMSFGVPAPVSARQVAEPGAELTVYLATMGPGREVWEHFGHNAIWIHDATTRTTISYNYGIFDFRQDRFWPRLMKGDMLYEMGVADADAEVARYAYFDRTVWVQRLNLLPAQRHALREFLEWNWLPQNREYPYDYFRDNCSTRVRDALDMALGGALRQALEGVPTGQTYRSHSLRLTARSTGTYAGLLLGLGLPTDRGIDAWEESFIPMELMRHVRSVRVHDVDGAEVPLVAEESTVFEGTLSPAPERAPNRTAVYLLVGLAIGAVMAVLARAGRIRRHARFALAATIFFWSLTTGFFGLILAMLWLFTNHTAAYPNTNLLPVNPLGLVLAIAAPLWLLAAERRVYSRTARLAFPLAVALASMSLLGLVLHLFPGTRQQSLGILALTLPVHLAVVLSLYHVRPPRTSTPVDAHG